MKLNRQTRLILLFILNNEGNSNYIQTIPAGQNGSFIRLIEHEDDASEV